MKYLVTGATGFLGTHVVHALEAHGHEVIRFARSLGGDILDGAAVARAADGCNGAFHCAGNVTRDPAAAGSLYRVHVEGTRSVLDACESAGVPRVVVASTSGTVAVSDDPSHVANENSTVPLAIVSRWPYYRAKLFAERIALDSRSGPMEVVCVNPSLLLGPGDPTASSTIDVRRFLERSIHAVPSGGLSFVDARDAAEAMRLAMIRGRPRERYLVSACNLTMRDFMNRLSRVSGVSAPIVPLPLPASAVRAGAEWIERFALRLGVTSPIDPVTAEMAQYFWYVDATKAHVELGWSSRDPSITLYETVKDLRARGVVWPGVDQAWAVPGEHGDELATRDGA